VYGYYLKNLHIVKLSQYASPRPSITRSGGFDLPCAPAFFRIERTISSKGSVIIKVNAVSDRPETDITRNCPVPPNRKTTHSTMYDTTEV
jgi:hypothetical protein